MDKAEINIKGKNKVVSGEILSEKNMWSSLFASELALQRALHKWNLLHFSILTLFISFERALLFDLVTGAKEFQVFR
jgi:hypothetical protein